MAIKQGSQYRYSVIIEVGIDTNQVKTGDDAIKRQFRSWEQDADRAAQRIGQSVDRINATINKSATEAVLANDRIAASQNRRLASEEKLRQAKAQTIIAEEKAYQSLIRTELMEMRLQAAQENRSRQHINNLDREAAAERRAQAATQARIDAIEKFFRQRDDFDAAIARKDPFQRGTQIEAESLTADLEAQSRRQRSQTDRLLSFANTEIRQAKERITQTLDAQKIDDVDRAVKRVDKSSRQAAGGFGMLGQAFKGAFVGAVAGLTFATLIAFMTGLVRTTAELSVAAIKLGGDFQVTTNSLTVFTGSARLAKEELAAVDQIARNTAGLRLINAQEGYQQLRALGFNAKLAQGFIKELGEEKILSGASDEALQRITFNFAQIASGGQRVSQEMREIVTQMPTLKRAFEEAFGTTDPQRIQRFFDEDTNAAFQRLLDAMARGEAAAGGLNDAWGKLMDEFIRGGRAFAEPILDPLTESMKDLTGFLRDNQSVWREWGEEIGGVIAGINAALDASGIPSRKGRAGWIGYFGGSLGTFGAGLETYLEAGYMATRAASAAKERKGIKFALPTGLGFLGNILPEEQQEQIRRLNESQEERRARERAEQEQQRRVAESRRKQGLEILEQNQDLTNTLAERRFQVEEAMRESYIRRTTADELQFHQRQSQAKESFLRSELARQSKYFDDMIALTETNTEDDEKLRRKKLDVVSKISTDISLAEIEAAKKTQELEEKILEERRETAVESYNLAIRQVEQFTTREVSAIERRMRIEGDAYREGYDDLIQITQSSYESIADLTRRGFEERLLDLNLSSEQFINLQTEMNLTLERLEIEHTERMLQIQDRRLQKSIERIDRQAEMESSRLNRRAGEISTFGGALGQNVIDKDFVKNLNVSLFGFETDYDQFINNYKVKVAGLQKAIEDSQNAHLYMKQTLGRVLTDDESKKFWERHDKLRATLEEEEKNLRLLTEGYPAYTVELYRTVRAYEEGTASIRELQRIQDGLFDKETLTRAKEFDARIEAITAKIRTGTTAEGAAVDANQLNKWKQERDTLISEKTVFLFDRANEKGQRFRQTIAGIEAEIEKLQKNDPAMLRRLNDAFLGERLEEVRDSYIEINRLKYELANSPLIDAQAIEIAQLEDLLNLRGQETEAIISSNRSRLQLQNQLVFSRNRADAEFLDFLSREKGVTEIFSDARINLVSSAYDRLGEVFTRLTSKLGMFGRVVKDVLEGFVRLALNRVFMRMFGFEGGIGTGGFGTNRQGGFSLPSLLFGGGGGGGGAGLGRFLPPSFSGQPIFGTGGMFGGGGGVMAGGMLSGLPGGSIRQDVLSQQLGGLISSPAVLEGGGWTRGGEVFAHAGASGRYSGIFGKAAGGAGMLGSFASILPLLGAGLGAGLGRGNMTASILGGAGGLLAGAGILSALAPGVLAGMLGGLGVGGALAGSLALAAAPIALFAAPLLLIGAHLLGRNAQRRREEKLRTEILNNALSAVDKLIAEVERNPRSAIQALERGEDIKQEYIKQVNENIKDKKTRGIAMEEIVQARPGSNLALKKRLDRLAEVAAGAESRLTQSAWLVPTFADGGEISGFAARNYMRNPLGYVRGAGTDRSDSILAYFDSVRGHRRISNNEYVLDAETTRNVGVEVLDYLRATKGLGAKSFLPKPSIPQSSMADGGSLSNTTIVATPQPQNDRTPGSMQMTLNANIVIGAETLIEVVNAHLQTEDGRRYVVNANTNTVRRNGAGSGLGKEIVLMLKDAKLIK